MQRCRADYVHTVNECSLTFPPHNADSVVLATSTFDIECVTRRWIRDMTFGLLGRPWIPTNDDQPFLSHVLFCFLLDFYAIRNKIYFKIYKYNYNVFALNVELCCLVMLLLLEIIRNCVEFDRDWNCFVEIRKVFFADWSKFSIFGSL